MSVTSMRFLQHGGLPCLLARWRGAAYCVRLRPGCRGDDSEAGLTAEMLGALLTATMPLTSDPLLLHMRRKHADFGRGD